MDKALQLSTVNKILVANRGEIALRIKRAARLLQIPVVAVFSALELDSSWIQQFDESYSLGYGILSDTYLNIPLIISMAKQSGADAIHPGYGFLSENPAFARACEENNIRFIGPSSDILKLMGDKLSAHEFVSRLGIPVTDKMINTPIEISKQGHKLDYPVLVKAAAGGGGKGMRIARSHRELTDVLEVTASEAYHFFADDRVYVEKYLRAPRHIEVQILGDNQGNIVHLFERECSVQRRHQKIAEEAPADCLSAGLRGRIIDAALTIAQAVHYVNAGTIEFLLDESGDFFFLEMNPRIQVEHGITEMITGIDLVKEQIRIAEGYPLPFTQSDIKCRGYAIETRIYAEDPENDLLPSPGTVHYFNMPDLENVRMESAVTSGTLIHAEFDPLVAKIITHGGTRAEAIQIMREALDRMILTGVHHNIPLIRWVLNDAGYLRNAISTTYLQDKSEEFRSDIRKRKEGVNISGLVMAGTLIALRVRNPLETGSVWHQSGRWRIVPRISFLFQDKRYGVYYQWTGPHSLDMWCNNQIFSLTHIKVDDNAVSFASNNKSYQFYHVPEIDGTIVLTAGSLDFEIHRIDRLKAIDYDYVQEEETKLPGVIRSPLPGKVIRVYVTVNEKVTRGDSLMTIESMKLENSILAPFTGIIEQIKICEGDQVKRHDPLIYLNPGIVLT